MGKVYLVGAGPGDPTLITVKGLRLIQSADVIMYDRLVNKDLLSEAKPSAKLFFCGKFPHAHPLKQEAINQLLVTYAQKYQTVVRLKGGDPFIFGRGGEEAEHLAENAVHFEIVPGITAGIAAPAYAGIPVTHRDLASSITFITGHGKSDGKETIDWPKLATGVDTLAIYMGVSSLPHIVSNLVTYGRKPTTPVALIEWGTTERQRTMISTLKDVIYEAEKHQIVNPTMIVVGEVVRFRDKLQWFSDNRTPVTLDEVGV
ncbi:uroporphyrinogen-III C-methyltransferase [Terrilactibacillus laevilacticus]|uniref:uroporphyrinogen-III C-methyltransferase n=1 Tax=Terrilactibacillus laevilacticus TaxID=1380157 RepID=A0ABW5PUT0_9BACI|nr:uroporphyrinogen-III C-methyltransferase [Terrilactibacillus laevilacticus]